MRSRPIRVAVRSTSVRSIGFDPECNVLEVEFHNRRVYQFFGVPRSVYESLMTAESKGRYVSKHIVPRFRAEELR